MNTKKKVYQIDKIMEAMRLAIEIQNAGIGTVFFNYAGHTNQTEINIHLPYFRSGVLPSFKCSFNNEDEESQKGHYLGNGDAAIEKLKGVLASAETLKTDAQILEDERQAERYKSYLQLKGEFEGPSAHQIAAEYLMTA